MPTPQIKTYDRPSIPLADDRYDTILVVASTPTIDFAPPVAKVLAAYRAIDDSFGAGVRVIAADGLPARRIVFSPYGPLDPDVDDLRMVERAARDGARRAVEAGARKVLLLADPDQDDGDEGAVAVLGALRGLWAPLEVRDHDGEHAEPVEELGVWTSDGPGPIDRVLALEQGRRLTRDLTMADPERASPLRFVDHCRVVFAETDVALEEIDNPEVLERDYPLLMAVARASMPVERHHPRVLRLRWRGAGEIKRTVLLAGKGVTYDTGGADIKHGGSMMGMSRDKGGAATVVGLVRALADLAPPGLEVIAEVGLVRNSVGADAFVSDEVIIAHSGTRVRIGNTDAEGRLVLADLLSNLRTRALDGAPAPHLVSIATLTGHALLTAGPCSIAIDNSVARAAGTAEHLAHVGERWAEPFMVSRLRREDAAVVRPKRPAADVLSCNNKASSATMRGHQFPAVFLIRAAGLDAHRTAAEGLPLPFTHLDIGGGAFEAGDWINGEPTAAPLATLAAWLSNPEA